MFKNQIEKWKNASVPRMVEKATSPFDMSLSVMPLKNTALPADLKIPGSNIEGFIITDKQTSVFLQVDIKNECFLVTCDYKNWDEQGTVAFADIMESVEAVVVIFLRLKIHEAQGRLYRESSRRDQENDRREP